MQKEMIGTVGIYVRVSTVEQAEEGYSIAAQKERLKAYCKAQGWSDYKFYVDEGVSAKDMKRPQLEKLFEHVKESKINIILVYRLDRFTRSVRDLHKMLEIMERHKCGFKSATEVYDTTTAMGRLFITIVAALAEWESDNSSERIKMALEKKVADGERVGGIPFGFDLNEEEKLVANEQSKVVLNIIKLLKSGKSITAISNYLNDTNNDRVTWYPMALFRILRNPALYGATYWSGKVHDDTHDGIITKKEFDHIQTLLDDRAINQRRDVAGVYLFQAILVCPSCGNRMSVNRFFSKNKGKEVQRCVYKCLKCIKAKTFTNAIGESHFLKALYEYMERFDINTYKQPVDIDDEYGRLSSTLAAIERKREKYQKGWASDLITDEEFGRLMKETKDPYEKAKKDMESYRPPVQYDLDNITDLTRHFNSNFKKLSTTEKREFIATFIKAIHFKVVPQPPKNPRNKKGKPLIVMTDVVFY